MPIRGVCGAAVLENGVGKHKRPSATTVYGIGKALGVAMSDLLGRPLTIERCLQRWRRRFLGRSIGCLANELPASTSP